MTERLLDLGDRERLRAGNAFDSRALIALDDRRLPVLAHDARTALHFREFEVGFDLLLRFLFEPQLATQFDHFFLLSHYLYFKAVVNFNFFLLERLKLGFKLMQVGHREADRFKVRIAAEFAPQLHGWLLGSNLDLILKFSQLFLRKHNFEVHLVSVRVVFSRLDLQCFVVNFCPAHFLDKVDKFLLSVRCITKILQCAFLHLDYLLYLAGPSFLLLQPILQMNMLVLERHYSLDVVAILKSRAHVNYRLRGRIALFSHFL